MSENFKFDLNPFTLADIVAKVTEEKQDQANEKLCAVLELVAGNILEKAENGSSYLNIEYTDIYDYVYGIEYNEEKYKTVQDFLEKYGEEKRKESKIIYTKLKSFLKDTMFCINSYNNSFTISWREKDIIEKKESLELQENLSKNIRTKKDFISIAGLLIIDKKTGKKYIRTKNIEKDHILYYAGEYFSSVTYLGDYSFPTHMVDVTDRIKRAYVTMSEIRAVRDVFYYDKKHIYRKYKSFKPLEG